MYALSTVAIYRHACTIIITSANTAHPSVMAQARQSFAAMPNTDATSTTTHKATSRALMPRAYTYHLSRPGLP